MKAIVLAGGEGTRLRPLTAECPKPMIKLLDKPVLEHIVRLLKNNGVTEICMTLGYLPDVVTGYFGDGSDFGVSIKYNIEREPLGTAGGVAACRKFIGKDDFIVISGDGVCDLNIAQLDAYHRQKNADVTIALTEHQEPLEFGVVVTQADGRVEGFVEKPEWDRVSSNMVNTGIYIISNNVLESIPENTVYDFSRDLFPKLMVNKKRLFGFETKGYWRDIGNCSSYLQCVRDVLDGRVNMEKDTPEIMPGIWSQIPLEGKDYELKAPVFIGSGAVIAEGVKIGPYAVIGSKSIVKKGANIKNSVIDGASIGEYSSLDGAVVCRNSIVEDRVIAEEGSVIGEKTLVGCNSRILKNVKIWPERKIESGSKVYENIVRGQLRRGLEFLGGSSISGEINISITPEECVSLGAASAYMGRVGVGWGGSNGAKLLATAFGSGVCSAGAELIEFDECFDAAAAYFGKKMGIPITVFFSQDDNKINISFFDIEGRPLKREMQRKIETILSNGYERAPGSRAGGAVSVSGILEMYASEAVREAAVTEECSTTAVITGEGPAAAAFAYALTVMGAKAAGHDKNSPKFEISADGFCVTAVDENGRHLSAEQICVIAAMTEFDKGESAVHVNRYAPEALDKLAKEYGGEIIRDGCENDVMRNGVFTAVRICSSMSAKHEKLSDMADRIPNFAVSVREVPVTKGRGHVMKNLHYAHFESDGNNAIGFTVSTGNGFVRIVPSGVRHALIISSEADNEEIAEELCNDFEKLIKNADSDKNHDN